MQEPMTCEQVAIELGMSASGVNLIERRALKKCLYILNSYGITADQLFAAFYGNSNYRMEKK